MPDSRIHQIRQAILSDLADRYPGGRNLASLSSAPNCQAIAAQPGEILEQARFLEAGLFVLDLKPGRDPYWKATYTGLAQIRREATPVEDIWGDTAL